MFFNNDLHCSLSYSHISSRRTGNLEIILEILWELIVHRESKVRRNVAKLFAALVRS